MYRRYLEFPSYVNGGKVEPHWMADGSSFWCEDQAFLVKVYLRARVFVSDECLDRYRLHEDSCCAVVERAGEYDVW